MPTSSRGSHRHADKQTCGHMHTLPHAHKFTQTQITRIRLHSCYQSSYILVVVRILAHIFPCFSFENSVSTSNHSYSSLTRASEVGRALITFRASMRFLASSFRALGRWLLRFGYQIAKCRRVSCPDLLGLGFWTSRM